MKFTIHFIWTLTFIAMIIQLLIVFLTTQKFNNRFLFNEKNTWSPNIYRLNLFCSISFFLFTCFIAKKIIMSSTSLINIIIGLISIMSITFLSYVLIYKNKKTTQVELRGNITTSKITNDFKINISKDILDNTFEILKKHDLIKNFNDENSIPNKELFINTLLDNKLPEYKIFKLELDNIQTKYIYDKIQANSKSLTLDKFLMIFGNKNPKATPNSITTSSNKSINETPKNIEILKNLF